MMTTHPPTRTAVAAPEPEGFIHKEEVAKRLQKSIRTVENWRRQGFIPFMKNPKVLPMY